MTDDALDITVYYEDEGPALLSLVRELDDLDISYEECRISQLSTEARDRLKVAGDGEPASPTVSINGELLIRPTAANVMSAIMHARSAGFYQ